MIPDSLFINMTIDLNSLWNATITEQGVTFHVKGLWNS